MQEPKYQFEAEDKIIIENLMKAGYGALDAMNMLNRIKEETMICKEDRNLMIREISFYLTGNKCALRTWYVHDIIAKVSRLSATYVMRLAYTTGPFDVPKKSAITE
jgi:hypothetical protein